MKKVSNQYELLEGVKKDEKEFTNNFETVSCFEFSSDCKGYNRGVVSCDKIFSILFKFPS
jgi:hypothetical protein